MAHALQQSPRPDVPWRCPPPSSDVLPSAPSNLVGWFLYALEKIGPNAPAGIVGAAALEAARAARGTFVGVLYGLASAP